MALLAIQTQELPFNRGKSRKIKEKRKNEETFL
jgi:hypothetical protein